MSLEVAKETLRVLLVGGSDAERTRWSDALASVGLDVELEPDLERALLIAAELRPSAIVLDLAIPGRDSLQLAAAIRADARTWETALVALAPAVGLDVVALARCRGCDAVLSKRSSAHVLASVVMRAMSRRARRRPAA